MGRGLDVREDIVAETPLQYTQRPLCIVVSVFIISVCIVVGTWVTVVGVR